MIAKAEVGRGALRVAVPKLGISDPVEIDRATLSSSFGPGEPLAVDHLTIAAVAFSLDRLVPRSTARDAWGRSFSVSIPVSNASAWEGVAGNLSGMLRFLTGDDWEFHFTKGSADPFHSDYRPPQLRITNVERAQLFSGGLDSYAGAIFALTSSNVPLLLIGHQDQPGAPAAQARLVARFDADRRFMGKTHLRTIRLAPSGAGAREPTSRSRSLIFIALALYAIRSLDLRSPVFIPENGFIAVNPPLTLARLGAASTRTTHPYLLSSLEATWRKVGIGQEIANPWEFQTKGEALATCGDVNLLRAGIEDSVSCAHAGRRAHWVRREARNCGYCWPCLIRRASLHHVGLDKGRAYGFDVLRRELPLEWDSAADLRALFAMLRDSGSDRMIRQRILLTGPLPGDRARYLDVVKRGLNELRAWVLTGGRDFRRLSGA